MTASLWHAVGRFCFAASTCSCAGVKYAWNSADQSNKLSAADPEGSYG